MLCCMHLNILKYLLYDVSRLDSPLKPASACYITVFALPELGRHGMTLRVCRMVGPVDTIMTTEALSKFCIPSGPQTFTLPLLV